MIGKPSRPWQSIAALLLALLGAITLPGWEMGAEYGHGRTMAVLGLIAAGALFSAFIKSRGTQIFILIIAAHLGVWLLLSGISEPVAPATSWSGLWLVFPFYAMLFGTWLLAWRGVVLLSELEPEAVAFRTALNLLIPAIFGIWILILWEAITRGAGIPFILLPPPSAVGARIVTSMDILAADFVQTVLKAVLSGFVIGSLAGFTVAILADRYRFFANGLLPIGNMVSALPMIGIAPIMVIWFGFDWQSKAAVVVVMTFFPMLVNTLAGLASTGHMERDLMRTYGAGHWQVLIKLRLQAAMPFIFNALKINSTLALIGAIVAEFFGTPVVGMGFRISTEIGRLNLDMVWAEIALAAVVGSLFYGLLALFERTATFWHPSYRR